MFIISVNLNSLLFSTKPPYIYNLSQCLQEKVNNNKIHLFSWILDSFVLPQCIGIVHFALPQCIGIVHFALPQCIGIVHFALPQCIGIVHFALPQCIGIVHFALPQCICIVHFALPQCIGIVHFALPQCIGIVHFALPQCIGIVHFALPQCIGIVHFASQYIGIYYTVFYQKLIMDLLCFSVHRKDHEVLLCFLPNIILYFCEILCFCHSYNTRTKHYITKLTSSVLSKHRKNKKYRRLTAYYQVAPAH